ncbi:unnamed protein product [Caretta caretta]
METIAEMVRTSPPGIKQREHFYLETTGRFERVPRAYSNPRMSDANTLNTTEVATGPTTPRKGPPKFKQRQTRQFKSKPPKKGVKGFGDDIPGMEGLGTDITVICPWEAFSHLELHELAQFGII